MASVNKVVCPTCQREYMRTTKQVNVVVRRNGIWRCKTCATTERNKRDAKPIGSTRMHSQSGYLEEKTPDGWRRQHIAVVERMIGRRLLPNEAVHHINEVKTDNRPENLQLMAHGDHTAIHHTGIKRTKEQAERIRNAVRSCRNTKLTPESVAQIRESVRSGGATQKSLADLFGVSPITVSRVVNNKTWS